MLSLFAAAVVAISPDLWVLFMTAVLSPIITEIVKRWIPGLSAQLATTINQAIATVLTLIAWALLGGGDQAQLASWFLWGQASGGMGTTGYNVLKVIAKKIASR
jgi:hypothetical protein